MELERARGLSDVFKNLVIACGVVMGGIWGWFVFGEKLEAEKAKVDLERAYLEIKTRAAIAPSITTTLSKATGEDKTWLLHTKVTLENTGDDDAQVKLYEDTLIVAEVVFEDGVIREYDNPIRNSVHFVRPESKVETEASEPWEATRTFILAGQTKTYRFVTSLSKPGLYRVQFMGEAGENVQATRSQVSSPSEEEHIAIITVSDYVLVGEQPG